MTCIVNRTEPLMLSGTVSVTAPTGCGPLDVYHLVSRELTGNYVPRRVWIVAAAAP